MSSRKKRLPGVVRDLPAGLFDAGMASLATFLTGLAAVNFLSDIDRGVYSVFFAAFIAASVVPQFLIYTPYEIEIVNRPVEGRLTDVIASIRLGMGPTVLSFGAIAVAALATAASQTTPGVIVALSVTSCAALLVSPAQDHVRRLLHIARRSWSSTSMSALQLVMVAVGIVGLRGLGAPDAWIPFGALALANVATLSLGLFLTHSKRRGSVSSPLTFRELAASGRWLLATALAPRAALLVGSIMIVYLAGEEAMGFAESARVTAQPVLVVGTGLSAVLGPRGMEAAIGRNLSRARRHHRAYVGLVAALGLAYLAVAGTAWSFNPMQSLVPSAYVVEGLVAVTIVANIITAATFQYRNELMGGRKEVQLTWIGVVAATLIVVGSATAAVAGAFARPISVTMDATFRYGAYWVARSRMYRGAVNHDGAASSRSRRG